MPRVPEDENDWPRMWWQRKTAPFNYTGKHSPWRALPAHSLFKTITAVCLVGYSLLIASLCAKLMANRHRIAAQSRWLLGWNAIVFLINSKGETKSLRESDKIRNCSVRWSAIGQHLGSVVWGCFCLCLVTEPDWQSQELCRLCTKYKPNGLPDGKLLFNLFQPYKMSAMICVCDEDEIAQEYKAHLQLYRRSWFIF